MTHVNVMNAKMDTYKAIEKDIDLLMKDRGVESMSVQERCAFYAACNGMKEMLNKHRGNTI